VIDAIGLVDLVAEWHSHSVISAEVVLIANLATSRYEEERSAVDL
jgi:hypothetical protein